MPCHERIRCLRLERKLTQATLARLVKKWLPWIDDSDISRIETGRRGVRADEVPAFAKALGCRPEDLLDNPDELAPSLIE